jgi:hypothetical protein
MYGLTRATTTLIAAGVAGLLIWLATQLSNDHTGGYWARVGLVAAAGLVMALSQLIGGWTKWGMPRLSIPVLLTAFVPVAIVSLWVILAGQPTGSWFHDHVMSWTRDLHISGLVTDMLYYIPVLAFGTGLVFGYSFDTTGPRVRDREVVDGRRGATTGRGRRTTTDDTAYDRDADAPLTADRTADTQARDRETEPTRRGMFGRRRTTSDDTAYDRDGDAQRGADGQPSDREPVASETTTRSTRTSDDT